MLSSNPSGSYRRCGQPMPYNGRSYAPVRWDNITALFRWAITYDRTTGTLFLVQDLGRQRLTNGSFQLGDTPAHTPADLAEIAALEALL